MKSKISLFILLMVTFSITSLYSQITILSGPSQASYYEFVEDMEKVLNTDSEKLVINKESSGAAFNFDQLVDPKSPIKVVMMQSDYLYYMESLDFRDNTDKTKSVKVILPLAHEEIHVVTKERLGFTKLQDLDSMTVAIGTKNQGTYATANLIKDRSQTYWRSRNIPFADALKELSMDRAHAFMIVGSAPLPKLNINPQALLEEISLVELQDYNDWAKYYDHDTIYAKDYKWLEKDVPTFSVRTVLVVNESKLNDLDRKAISKLVNGIMGKYDVLKAQGHPKWKEVKFDNWDESDWPMYK